MKRIRIVELLATIRANLVAFFSISMFVCLGVGLFLGIQWGAEALRGAAQDTFARGRLHDIEVQFPYGLTDSDLAQLAEVEGVSYVERGYSAFVVMEDGSTSHTLKLQSMGEELDVPTAVHGNMPMEADEVALLRFWAEAHDVAIGDTITLRHDATDETDEDGMAYLTSDTLTVTALVDSPAYAYTNSASLGVSNIGSGAIDCVGFVPQESFDASAFFDGWSNAYLRCDSCEGLSTFSAAYRDAVEPIEQAVTKLGGTLGNARYQELHDDAQSKIDEGEQKVDEGEKAITDAEAQLAEGEQQLAEGEQRLAEGEQQLAEGKEELANQQVLGTQQLSEAYRRLSEGQAAYDAGVQEYNTASDLYNQANAKFESVRATYDRMMEMHDSVRNHYNALVERQNAFSAALDAYEAAPDEEKDGTWAAVESSYASLKDEYDATLADYNSLVTFAESVGDVLGLPISLGGLGELSGGITPDNAESYRRATQTVTDTLGRVLDRIDGASISVSGITITLADVPGGLQQVYDKLAQSKATLDASKARLDAGWSEYNAALSTYDRQVTAGRQQIDAGSKELESKRAEAEEGAQRLEDGRAELDEKKGELDEGKADLEAAKDRFAQMVAYEWIVMPRQEMGGTQGVDMVAGMMDNVRWAMASLFIVVGLFVCYSAISRLVHEQIVQIGTKKALGFREGEISALYLAFSGLAVLIGVGMSVALAVFLVQGIMNPTAARQFTLDAYGPYVSLADLALVGALELALILLATWFAIHGLLKREALDLLRGESTANVREHFYERWGLWQRMSLYSQTIVNNCVNDKRRVAGTLVGVVGCTALIVVAVTLASNVGLSHTRHYDEVYAYDSIVYLDKEGDEGARSVAMALYDKGIGSTPAFTRRLTVRQSNGTRSSATLVVPTNVASFDKFYHVVSTAGGEARIDEGGLWVSAAYAEHMGAKVGDEMTLTENTGKTHTFTIAGFFDYYLLRQEFVLSQMAYREAFGTKPQANVLLVNRDGADVDVLRDYLSGVEGYSSLVDDYADADYAFSEMESILRTVVLIYLVLSALMALMVLLNLDIMFVDEKKRELIVLMINGFSTRDAQAYIYRDSIALTVIGVVLGIALGAVMGAVTVFALEPESGFFVKGFNGMAALAGAGGAAFFSAVVLIYALRRIPRFDLTDINRF